jgi:hypothetical protein
MILMRLINELDLKINQRKLFRIIEFILSRTNLMNNINEQNISEIVKYLNLFN